MQMSGPTSSEAPAEAPVVDPVSEATSEIPDAAPETADSFASAIDQAFANLESGGETAPEPESALEPEPSPQSEPAPEPEPEPVSEPTSDESFDPTDPLTEDIGDDWTPKAANRFKQLKSELKETSSELAALRQQQEEYTQKIKELTGTVESNDVEALQAKLAEYEQSQMFNNLENTDAYKTAVAEPLSNIIEEAQQIAEKYAVDSESLIDILSLSDPEEQDTQLGDLLQDASDRDRARVYRLIDQIDPILEKRDSLRENAEAALKEAALLEEQREQQQAAEKLAIRQNVARNVVERVQQKLPFLSGIEGLDLAAIQEKAASVDPSVMHPVDSSFNSVSAQLLPAVVREYMSMRAENAALTDRLAEYETAEPTMSGASPTSGSVAGAADDGLSFEEKVAAAFTAKGLGA